MAAFCSALIGFLTYIASESELQSLVFWQMGSLARANPGPMWRRWCPCLPSARSRSGWPRRWTCWRWANARHSTWLDVTRTRRRLVAFSALLVGAAVALPASISFVGLVPHVARLLVGPASLAAAVVRPARCAADRGGRHRGPHARSAGGDSAGLVPRPRWARRSSSGWCCSAARRTMSALLKLHEVVVRRQQREILHGIISLAFEPGTVDCAGWPSNGAGKSTLRR